MPTYEYECTECKHIQEEEHPMRSFPQTTKCEKCGKKANKIFSRVTGIVEEDFFSSDANY